MRVVCILFCSLCDHDNGNLFSGPGKVLVLVLVLKEKVLVLVLTKKSWSWSWKNMEVLVLVLVLRPRVLVLTKKSYLHHWWFLCNLPDPFVPRSSWLSSPASLVIASTVAWSASWDFYRFLICRSCLRYWNNSSREVVDTSQHVPRHGGRRRLEIVQASLEHYCIGSEYIWSPISLSPNRILLHLFTSLQALPVQPTFNVHVLIAQWRCHFGH